MCGNRRRAAHHHGGAKAVMAVIDGLQQMNLASQQQHQYQQSQTRHLETNPAVTELPAQTRGAVYPSTYDDEKKPFPEKENVSFEVLPTYEESTEVQTPTMRTAESAPVRAVEPVYQPQTSATAMLSSNNARLQASPSINVFTTALAAYRSGNSGCCGKGRAKRAAREVMRELMEAETTRSKAAHGPLRCGQRKQIRRDLEPVRAMLDDAIRDVRRVRV